MIVRKGMNFDLAWLQSDLGDIAAARQAVVKDMHMTPSHFSVASHFCEGGAGQLVPQMTSSCVVR